MRNFILSAALAVSAIVSSGAAEAADLPVRPYTKAPVVVDPIYNWTGFYIGANLGWSFGRSKTDVSIAGAPFAFTSQRMDGILGGLQAGYNWQSGRAVFGLETDIQATDQKGSSSLFGFILPQSPELLPSQVSSAIRTSSPGLARSAVASVSRRRIAGWSMRRAASLMARFRPNTK